VDGEPTQLRGLICEFLAGDVLLSRGGSRGGVEGVATPPLSSIFFVVV